VLGEMLYALEYRDKPVSLQYAKGEDDDQRTVSLPDNLFIIGTMNTSDRSIGHLDYAVRRRFAFVALKPDIEVLNINPENIRKPSKDAFSKVATLFSNSAQISADYNAADVQPGHSYFIVDSEDELAQRLKYEVGPLLREYVADGILMRDAMNIIAEIEDGNYY
jgi:5-methylcytosine-specific restriction protein B